MKISQREIFMIAVCAVVVLFIGLPSVKNLMPAGSGKSVRQLNSQKAAAEKQSAGLRGENDQLERQIRSLTYAENPEQLPPILLKGLHATAAESGVTLASFRPGRVQAVQGGSKLPITVQINAPYPRVMAFLERLRAAQGRVALERLQVAATDANTDRIGMELRLAVYSTVPVAAKEKAPKSNSKSSSSQSSSSS